MYERLFPDGHPRRARAMGTLALVLHRAETNDEAVNLIARAEVMVLKFEPPEGPNAKRVLDAKAEVRGERTRRR